MFPHSQTGMNVPHKEIESRLSSGRFGNNWIRRCVVAKRRMTTETKAPKITKGRASTTMLSVKVMKSCSLVGNEKLKAFVAAVFNHSKSVIAKPHPIKMIRKRATARLLNLTVCVFCMRAV
jgi:hypothetical protein